MNILELKDLQVRRGEKHILHDINLTVRAGDKLLIKGPSGSGKSTLLKALLGFEACSRGAVLCDGVEVSSKNIREFRTHCAYIGQNPLAYEGGVQEYLDLPFVFRRNRHRRPGKESVLEILRALGFGADVFDKEYRDLSGGEQQRMTIAQALLLERTVYLLDEVTSSLDQENILRVIDLFTALPERTVIAVSHNHEWQRGGIRVLELKNGNLCEQEGAA